MFLLSFRIFRFRLNSTSEEFVFWVGDGVLAALSMSKLMLWLWLELVLDGTGNVEDGRDEILGKHKIYVMRFVVNAFINFELFYLFFFIFLHILPRNKIIFVTLLERYLCACAWYHKLVFILEIHLQVWILSLSCYFSVFIRHRHHIDISRHHQLSTWKAKKHHIIRFRYNDYSA